MNKPQMIIFDYGQTLINEKKFDPLAGTKAILNEAANNPNNVPAEEVQEFANQLGREMGRFGVEFKEESFLEVHNHVFQNYLYDYFGIELTKSNKEVEEIFTNAAITAEPTKNIEKFLKFLEEQNIRTSVVSNLSFSGQYLKNHIDKLIPSNKFEFIITSSEYIFRKPHKRIFEIAVKKAKLNFCDVWYCGDNAVYDVDGAANCGIFSVWYKGAIEASNRATPNNKCLDIYSWDELENVIRSL